MMPEGVISIVSANNNILWTHNIWLDPYEKYSLKWTVNADNQSIDFLCEVRTTGWIGLGLSPNGGMKSSDIIIAWIDDNTGITHFHDRFASGESVPQIDESQDWYLISSKQNSTHTVIHFQRPLITCDHNNDRDITRDTTRLIYAYSDSDPQSDTDLKMHSSHQRGSKSVLLLTDPSTQKYEPMVHELNNRNIQNPLIINVKNITIDKKETTYWCKIVKFSTIDGHVIKFKPYITSGNEPFVHHMSIYTCFHPNPTLLDKFIDNEGSDCTDSKSMPQDFNHCFTPLLMWAVGGGTYNLPPDVGFPMGQSSDITYLMLNIHYDNPDQVVGRQDSSGLEIYLTQKLRKYEAHTLSFGSALDNRLFVPPKQKQFHMSGHCHTKCFEKVLDPNGLKVFAVWPHAHLLATKVKVRHFRGDEELPWLEFDSNYDFNLQSFRTLDPMVIIKMGDQLTVECEYDSSTKNKTVMGGYGTSDEMCAAFLYYYPKMTPSKPCFSGLTNQNIQTLADISFDSDNSVNEKIGLNLQQYISRKQDWNQTLLDNSYDIMLNITQQLECFWIKTGNEFVGTIGYPNIQHVYRPTERECRITKSAETDDNFTQHSFIVIMFAIASVVTAIILAIIFSYRHREEPTNNGRNNTLL
ncbi:DBH-like monooxygenase protein 2 homolog [Oppia nitens]|uniref:DBH-like monooxygenase protein 2 homolog n=1 Tax=Oppia nitens TaxID=1686743 RepID=UPI0023DCD390|nr:DBH-like monooxygenase protein 2 homolog [Oppia nitens]